LTDNPNHNERQQTKAFHADKLLIKSDKNRIKDYFKGIKQKPLNLPDQKLSDLIRVQEVLFLFGL